MAMVSTDARVTTSLGAENLRSVLAGALLVLPWLYPHAGGPSASVEPWLFSALCGCAFAALSPSWTMRASWGFFFAALLGWALLRTGATFDVLALGGALALMLAVAGACAGGDPERAARTVAWAWVFAGVVSTLIALAQYLGAADALGPLASASGQGEAYANLRQRNQFATLTAIALAALLWGRPSPAAWAAAALLAIGNAATTSRTGLLELVTLAMLASLWSGDSRAGRVRLMFIALSAYALAAVLLPLLRRQFGFEAPMLWDRVSGVATCSGRGTLWSNVLHLIGERPWFGWGWGELDYAHYANLYAGERFCDILDNAHNLPLHLAVELGLPVALLMIAVAGWRVLRSRPWADTLPHRRMAWSVLAVIGLHSLLEYPLWYGPFQLAAAACVGLLANRPMPRGAAAWPAVRWALCAVLAAGLACAAWDYCRVSQIYLAPDERLPAYREDTLAKVRDPWIFRPQAAFAELTLTALTAANAKWTFEQSRALLHYSPEPRVIQRMIESATLLGDDRMAIWHLQRFKAAFPRDHAEWARTVLTEPTMARKGGEQR